MNLSSERGWVVLEDDGGLIPSENIVPVIREDARSDEVEAALAAVQEALTLEELTGMNERVEIDNEDPDLVAEEWLVEQGLIEDDRLGFPPPRGPRPATAAAVS